ncbi:hypothetical protein [Acaryochloris sp. CCMEE 5410]|uniref:hypothetical protein n=1 Tax=Acaryochloris sp. CCMEE 5410 TaxID=310037 RepID=UPI00024840B3|nr:hypothetical protein [Acaryochloris sp. CCMEE 5410]
MFSDQMGMFQAAFMRQVSTRVGLWVTEKDDQVLMLDADVSFPGRGIGLWILMLSLLPFFSNLFWADSSGYDFFNHQAFIPVRCLIAVLGFWLWLLQGKVLRCHFDKVQDQYVIEQNSYLRRQKVEGRLQDIARCEVIQVEKSGWFPIGKNIYSHIRVSIIQKSSETASFTFVERRSEIDRVIDTTYARLSEFLGLTADV